MYTFLPQISKEVKFSETRDLTGISISSIQQNPFVGIFNALPDDSDSFAESSACVCVGPVVKQMVNKLN